MPASLCKVPSAETSPYLDGITAKFSSIFYILISGAIGLFIYSVGYFKDKMKLKKASANNSEIALDENSNSTCINTDEQANASANIETTEINAEQVCDNNEIKNENSVSPENVTLNKTSAAGKAER